MVALRTLGRLLGLFFTYLIIPFMHMHWKTILLSQTYMFHFHVHNHEINRYMSSWWGWPFLLRPVWYMRHLQDPRIPLDVQIFDGIQCIGNPFIFMLIVPALIWLAISFKRYKNPLSIIALAGFFISGFRQGWWAGPLISTIFIR